MTDRAFQRGEVVGDRFELSAPLGKGAFGVVWKALDLHRERTPVAVKIFLEKYRADRQMLGRFIQEAKILEKLDHPNICRPLAFDAAGKDAFLAMELIEGETLDARFAGNSREDRPLPAEGIAWFCDQLSAAIEYAHQQGIIHRDLKPRNVMVHRNGHPPFVKVLDFGIAKMLVGSEVDPTTVGRVLGSVLYVSPEQVLGLPMTHRADVFSLGTIMFELITLRRAWARDDFGLPLPFHVAVPAGAMNSHVAVLKRIAREPRPKASQARAGLSKSLDAVLQQAMAIQPEDRFETPSAFAHALRGAL